MKNPWRTAPVFGTGIEVSEVLDPAVRLGLVEKYDEVKLRKIIAWPHTEEEVKEAARKRLRKLRRKGVSNDRT